MATADPWEASLRAARDDLARNWQWAIAPICPVPDVSRRFAALAEPVLAVLLDDEAASGQARAAGAGLARLCDKQPEALNRSIVAITRTVIGAVSAEHAAQVHPRLAAAITALVCGYFAAAPRRRTTPLPAALAALLASLEHERGCLSNLPATVCIFDTAGTLWLLAGAAARSIPAELICGYQAADLLAGLPDLLDDARRALAGETVTGERLFGPFVYHMAWGPLCDEAGRLRGTLLSVHDLTAPAEVWRRYRAQEAEATDAPGSAAGDTQASAPSALMAGEQDVLRLIAAGFTNAQIAVRLRISERAVEKRLGNVFRRLGATSRAEAVALAIRQGWM
jgi:DNA-binding CsgD family transcriptional regulator